MSLLQDIKESFESRNYLDEESMEDQNFNDTVEDDCTNQVDIEQSEYSDRKAEEEYEKEQEAVRSTIELLENNLEDIKSLSPAYTESAKEVVNVQLADASQALSLGSGFGQLELDDTGRVSMESYLEVRKALAKARKVYSVLSMEGIMDWFRGKGKTKSAPAKNPLEILKDNIEAGKERTEPIPGTELKYLAAKNLNPATVLSELERLIKHVDNIHYAYMQASTVAAQIVDEEIKALMDSRDSKTYQFQSKLKTVNSGIASAVKSPSPFIGNVVFTLKPDSHGVNVSQFIFNYNTSVYKGSINPMTLAQAKSVSDNVPKLIDMLNKITAKLHATAIEFPYDQGEGIYDTALYDYTRDPKKLEEIEAEIDGSCEWSYRLHRNSWGLSGLLESFLKELIKYAMLSTQ